MPYRRLPNTDVARMKALKRALEKSADTDFQDLIIPIHTIQHAKSVIMEFERLCRHYQQTYNAQIKANRPFQKKVKNLRMYLSHFMQVLYMCVMRAEIKANHLALYGLSEKNLSLPDLSSNEQLAAWGEKIIRGEDTRIANGGVPIFNPTIAKVKVMYSLFKEAYQSQQIHQKNTTRVQNEVANYRKTIDEVILSIWDEVEKASIDFPEEKRLAQNREYGVIYYYRKGESIA